MPTKICSKCKKEKSVSCFSKGEGKGGLQHVCKTCNKQYYKNNKLQILKRQKQWNNDNVLRKTKYQAQRYKDKAIQNVLFKTYSKQLEIFEKIRPCPEMPKILEVKCAYCGKWVIPTISQVKTRLQVFNGTIRGEHRFYCSENCKLACPTYNQNKWPKGFRQTTSREVVPLLRQLVLERDNYTCQKCGATTKTAQLHVHHILSYAQNKMQANDPDSCITLCKKCHLWIHSREGCRTVDLQCSRKEKN